MNLKIEPGRANRHPRWLGLCPVSFRTAVSKWQAMALRCIIEPRGYLPGHYLNFILRISMYDHTRLLIPIITDQFHKLKSFAAT